jgi:hypothetical protein
MEIHEPALETCEPSYMARAAKPFFILETYDLQRTSGQVEVPKPPGRGDRAQSHRARASSGALLIGEVGSGAIGHVVA